MPKPEHVAFYRSKRWNAVRRLAIERDQGLCVKCKARGVIKPGKEVDHVKPLATHPRLALKLSNLRYLCHLCHTRKTAADARKQIAICEHGYLEGICCIGGEKI